MADFLTQEEINQLLDCIEEDEMVGTQNTIPGLEEYEVSMDDVKRENVELREKVDKLEKDKAMLEEYIYLIARAKELSVKLDKMGIKT